jgi:hypothetical protein
VGLNERIKLELRRQRSRVLEAESLGDERDLRPRDLSDAAQIAALLRSMCSRSPKWSPWRAPYSYMLAERINRDHETSELSLSGYVRGRALLADMLVHVTGVRSFEVSCIHTAQDPCPVKRPTAPHVPTLICQRNEASADKLEGEMPVPEGWDDGDGWADGDGSLDGTCRGDQSDDLHSSFDINKEVLLLASACVLRRLVGSRNRSDGANGIFCTRKGNTQCAAELTNLWLIIRMLDSFVIPHEPTRCG